MTDQIKSLLLSNDEQDVDGIAHRIKHLAVWYVMMSVLLTAALVYQIGKYIVGILSTAEDTDPINSPDEKAVKSYSRTKQYNSDFEEIPHPAGADIFALFRRCYDSASPDTEYLIITTEGETVPSDTLADIRGYDQRLLKKAEANADAECDECGSDRLAVDTLTVGESTTLDTLTCPECGSTQQ